MKIDVNGESLEYTGVETVRAFLENRCLNVEKMLVLLNGESLSAKELDHSLREGDRLEILRVAGGG